MNFMKNVVDNRRVLKSVKLLIYMNEQISYIENPQAINLRFDGDIAITIRCASDGESIEFMDGTAELVPQEMGEFGSEIVIDAIDLHPWRSILGCKVKAIFGITSGGKIFGYKFSFEANELFILNLGDEMFVFDRCPLQILEDEAAEILPI